MITDGVYKDFKNRNNWVAIIGSRNASDDEKETAYRLGKKCAKDGKIVVSGLAKGIDKEGHCGALDGGGITIAIVSTPINTPYYPPENKDLALRILKQGCIIHPFETPVTGYEKGFGVFQKRLVERSILNAYVCPNIVVVSNNNLEIRGGSKWALNYGTKINHSVYRLDSSWTWHKNPEFEVAKPWWIPEINFASFTNLLEDL